MVAAKHPREMSRARARVAVVPKRAGSKLVTFAIAHDPFDSHKAPPCVSLDSGSRGGIND